MPRQPHVRTVFLFACALFLRLWVPTGWMPAASGGAFAIEPCAAAAPLPMAHMNAAHHGSSHNGQHGGDCAFAPHHASVAQPAIAPPLLAPMRAAAPLAKQFATHTFATGPPAPPPPATGPPALA
jgi:hypothetical protein